MKQYIIKNKKAKIILWIDYVKQNYSIMPWEEDYEIKFSFKFISNKNRCVWPHIGKLIMTACQFAEKKLKENKK